MYGNQPMGGGSPYGAPTPVLGQGGGDGAVFGPGDLEEFRDCSKWMNMYAIVMIVVGVLACLTIVGILGGAISIILGVWTRNAAMAFQRVADNIASGTYNLMEAVRNLRNLYRLQMILMIVGVALAILQFLFLGTAMMAGLSGMSRGSGGGFSSGP
jgi:hypothetical protein